MSEHDELCTERLKGYSADSCGVCAALSLKAQIVRASERERHDRTCPPAIIERDAARVALAEAQAMIVRMAAVIYEQETEYLATEAWWEETKRQLDDVITEQLLELRELKRTEKS